jgi:hypothetical protein
LTPCGGVNFDPRGLYLNKLGRHSLEDVSCQISKHLRFRFFTRRFFKIFCKVIFCLPWQEVFFMDSYSLNNFGRTSCKEHSCRFLTNLAKWFKGRSCLKKLMTHRRTDAQTHRPWAITKAHLEHIVVR